MPYKDLGQQRSFQATWMWRRRMQWILENGPCQRCGTHDKLRVVYKDPSTKAVKTAAIWSCREERRAELLKLCIVLCDVCALDKRKEERQPQHGEVGRYDQGCRCVPCKAAKAEAMAEYRANKRLKERSSSS